jgi:hypothetical protein
LERNLARNSYVQVKTQQRKASEDERSAREENSGPRDFSE